MELWYSFIETVFPFQFLSYTFMKNALLAVLIVSPVFGLLGTMVVNNKMAFFSDALGHSVLTGIGIGVVLGMDMPVFSMILFSVLFAVLIVIVKRKNKSSMDMVISVFSSFAVALGIVLLSRSGGINKFSAYLVGDILSITSAEICTLFFVLLGVIVYWCFRFNDILLFSVNEDLATSRGINTKRVEIEFCIVIAVLVSVSVRMLGILIINAMLMLPAAAARNISGNVRSYSLMSVIISVVCAVLGLVTAYYLDAAASAMMIVISGILYFVTLYLKKVM